MPNDYTFTAGTTAGVIIVLCCLSPLQARICGSVHITSDHKSFETALKNCTVILGYLKVVTVELANETVLNQLSFPELTEVTDYVAIFFVKSLRSVGKLFPNLRIIRGESFIHDYSLIIYQNNDLEEIGLYNLMYIGRGGVIIDKNPRLCYVDTIDWHSIGASKFDYSAVDSEYCKEQCDPSCNGHCWNARYCQIVNPEGCHRECIGCTEFGSPKHCLLCKNMENDGECVRECPKDKFTHQNYKRCISAVECETLLDGAYLTFNGTCRSRCPTGYVRVPSSEGNCRSCGDHCVTYCRPLVINSFAKLQRFYGCTHVNGSLEIRISDAAIVPELPNYLSSIREIKGSLIIARSKAITSLEFLKSLKVINGSRLENNRYSIFVYENPDLKKLWDFNNFSLTIRHGNLTFFNNPLLCTEEIDKLANLTNFDNYTNAEVLSMSNGDESDCNTSDINTRIFVNSTNATISWDEPDEIKGNESVVTYAIYFARKADQSLQKESVCEVRSWNSSYISNNSFFMENLIPNTEYIFYIKTMTQEKNMLKSRTKSFITLSDDPDEPEEFEAISYSYDSIKLIWLPPLNPNGVLKSWHISVYVIPDNETYLGERNYCENPHKSTVSNDLMMENETFNGPNCCSKKKQVEMFLHEMYAFCDIRDNSIHNYENRACFNYLYSPDIPAYERDDFNEIESLISDNSTYREIAVNDGNATEYIIDGLKPFTSHVFFLSVCNENHTERQQCSPVLMSFSRTHKLETADDIKYITYEMKENSVIIRWEEPEEPNSILLAYTIQHKRTDLDHSSVLSHCITRDQFLKNNGMFMLTNLEPGEYMTRIQATSLPGKGRFSRHLRFIIPDNSVQSEWWSILTSVALMIIIISLIAFYLYYRRKHVADNIHLITNVNPDYAAPIYEEDEWEIDREDIDMNDKELGQGVFGKVYIGFLKSKGINCAIKTVNDNATENSISSFLYEANVMKSFNSHHVIRLIGVVSRGYPPLVLMELMLRGDLKTFLRKSRDSSQCITSVEMYKMAIEIADGMAYLTAKKFVHRDLAARNCMVAQDGTVKIGDFGMARDIYETDYYRKETRGLLPVRWMSPESLADGVFTSDSDVWSYGVVLWEMATLAEQPYQGLANDQVLQFVIGRGKLQRPTECPDLLYEIMQECWQWSPSKRPLFLDIVDKLQNFVGENFKLVSFFHSREGEEHRMNTKQKVYNPPAMGLQMPLGAYCRFNADDDMVMTFHEDQNLLNTKLLPTKGKKSSRPRPTSSKKAVTFRSVGDDFEN